ncbi:MAG: DUF1501 domain-containing protein [Pseudomonadota bacterium]|nr:DUF1501 domain-containing protein [Pseudomonadota bacterium]
MVSRRAFASLGALALGGALGGLLLPRRSLAAPPVIHRKFLFVYCVGGWDPTVVFAPKFGLDTVDMAAGSVAANVGGIDFVDAANRPAVRSFLGAYADRTCVLNGLEVRSVTHERCRRILFTGSSGADADDWPSIAAAATGTYLLPHLVLSGPSYTSTFGSAAVRVGSSGQLGELLDGTVFERADVPLVGLPASVNDLVAARVRARVEALTPSATAGRARTFLDAYGAALDQAALVQAISGEVDLVPDTSEACIDVSDTLGPALACLERGYSRSAIVQHGGFCDLGWDTHSDIELQSTNFELLFRDLAALVTELDARTGPGGGRLSDEVTVVVLSEMGRTPKLNGTGGKDHWTYTSAMLLGAGVAGGRVVGGYDDSLLGAPTDLATGELDGGGTALTAAHLGATLLAMADVDPGLYTSAEPILGAIQ